MTTRLDRPRDVAETGDIVLAIEGLTVDVAGPTGRVVVVEDVDLVLRRGRTLGVVGESGSGKTMTALSMMRLLRGTSARVVAGEVRFRGTNILQLSNSSMSRMRGRHIGMIFQQPRRSLDPSFSVGDQIAEVARRHLRLSRADAFRRAVAMLDRVGIPQASKRAADYPHTFSGGMCQRVMLAMALVASPEVLVADEPTTALDVTVQAQVLDLLRQLQGDLGLAVMLITHDLGVIAEACDDLAVMYAGQVVESAQVAQVFADPRHPYTEGLLASLPQAQTRGSRLVAIPGRVPPPSDWPTSCRFRSRCSYSREECAQPVALADRHGDERLDRCVRSTELTLRGIV